MKQDRIQVWSSGGGVQSTAIAALIVMDELRPDYSIIVDTEREMRTTWDYLDKFVRPALERVDIVLHRVRKSHYTTVDLYSSNGDLLIPAYTNQNVEIGKLPTFCSSEWKKRVMHRWATEQGIKKALVWMGFTIDELRRCKQILGKWQERYPLIERRMTRSDCIALVKKMGWPEPPRSSCYMCPNKSQQEWIWMKQHSSDDFKRAIKFEKYMRKKDDAIWLTQLGEPIEQIDFEKTDDLFGGGCDSGMCFV